MYEIIAIAARYLFAALMVLIVIRAWKITIVDARRAAMLRRLSPETGVCGEFLIMTGSGKVREGMRFPVIREGMIGSSSKADVRLRASGVHRAHAYFELTKKGLKIRTHANARLYNARGESRRDMLLGDGSRITVGSVELMLILSVAVEAPAEAPAEGIFDIPDDSPVLSRRNPRPAAPGTAPEYSAPSRAPEQSAPAYARPETPAQYARHDAAEPQPSPYARPTAVEVAPSPHTRPAAAESQPSPYARPTSAASRPAAGSPMRRPAPLEPGMQPAPDNVLSPRPAYARDSEATYAWRETVVDETTSRRTIVRESAYSADDLFMENAPVDPEPAVSPQNAPASDDIPGWDDPWSAPAKKPVVTRKPADDPFDV